VSKYDRKRNNQKNLLGHLEFLDLLQLRRMRGHKQCGLGALAQ